ncbi:hypothetical protein B0H13DRAFT_2266611 [Mycena leptocephala]|nr:hypothetical protein B0H13DRAFT_2266611 [Mycena leptocephala]
MQSAHCSEGSTAAQREGSKTRQDAGGGSAVPFPRARAHRRGTTVQSDPSFLPWARTSAVPTHAPSVLISASSQWNSRLFPTSTYARIGSETVAEQEYAQLRLRLRLRLRERRMVERDRVEKNTQRGAGEGGCQTMAGGNRRLQRQKRPSKPERQATKERPMDEQGGGVRLVCERPGVNENSGHLRDYERASEEGVQECTSRPRASVAPPPPPSRFCISFPSTSARLESTTHPPHTPCSQVCARGTYRLPRSGLFLLHIADPIRRTRERAPDVDPAAGSHGGVDTLTAAPQIQTRPAERRNQYDRGTRTADTHTCFLIRVRPRDSALRLHPHQLRERRRVGTEPEMRPIVTGYEAHRVHWARRAGIRGGLRVVEAARSKMRRRKCARRGVEEDRANGSEACNKQYGKLKCPSSYESSEGGKERCSVNPGYLRQAESESMSERPIQGQGKHGRPATAETMIHTVVPATRESGAAKNPQGICVIQSVADRWTRPKNGISMKKLTPDEGLAAEFLRQNFNDPKDQWVFTIECDRP